METLSSQRVAIILLSWKRPESLIELVSQLHSQTYQDFDTYVSNSSEDLDHIAMLDLALKNQDRTYLVHEDNQYSCFRRFNIARSLASDYDIFIFLDDDVKISNNFVKDSIAQYSPKTYFSWYVWQFLKGGQEYHKRIRVRDHYTDIHYGGPGISMVDSELFEQPEFFNVVGKQAYEIDDLWISYYCNHIAKWPIKYLDVSNIKLGGGDSHALYMDIGRRKYNKNSFLQELKATGWKL